MDELITKRQRWLHPPIRLPKKEHLLDAQNICSESLFGFAYFRHLSRGQDQPSLVILATFTAGRKYKIDLFALTRPRGCRAATGPVQVVRMGPEDRYYFVCHAVLLSYELLSLNGRARLAAVHIDTSSRHQ